VSNGPSFTRLHGDQRQPGEGLDRGRAGHPQAGATYQVRVFVSRDRAGKQVFLTGTARTKREAFPYAIQPALDAVREAVAGNSSSTT
jgi:hypothetical protein